ncbi:MAG: hypothetical protein JO001_05860 [Alphaproteobacteria bacterium]|nr:hypothetical protein [Alphaproteobacteria bacterium]
MEQDLDAMTGVGNYEGSRLSLNTVSLNGNADIEERDGEYITLGGYFRKRLTAEQKKGEKPEEVKLGNSIKVIMLKIRRALQERDGERLARWTSEHDGVDDIVELRSAYDKEVEVGSARRLREKYGNLRTVQNVYGLLLDGTKEPESVKIQIKGAALGSEAKADDVPTFYQYVSSFGKNADGEKEHLRQFATVLSAVKEKGKTGKAYFTINFTRGEQLAADMQAVADAALRDIHGKIVAQDQARSARIKAMKATPEVVAEGNAEPEADEAASDYPAEDINPDDIPF